MPFPHEKQEPREYGRSPGNGITEMPLSREPLATEGEATPGPDDYNPYDERERKQAEQAFGEARDPTAGNDPFVFDDVGDEIGEVELPSLDNSPTLAFDI